MATITASIPASLEADSASRPFEDDALTLKILEAGIPSLPDGLEKLREQLNITPSKEKELASTAPELEPYSHNDSVERGRQTALPTPPISRTSTTCDYGRPTSSVDQGSFGVLTPRDSISRTADSISISAAPSSTFERLYQPSSIQSAITDTSPGTSIVPSVSKKPLHGERAFQKETVATSNARLESQIAPPKSYQESNSNSNPGVANGQDCDGKQSLTPPIVCIDRKYYISTGMEIPLPSMNLWQGSIKARLEDVLCRESRATWDSEAALVLEFYMVGTNSKNLKPSIMITCCSSKRKKSIKSCLSELKWLKDSGLRYFVRVDKTFGHRMDGRDVDHPLVEARLPPGFQTLCGVYGQIRATICAPMFEQVPAKFTLGGLIRTDHGFGCLTAGHPFFVPAHKEPDMSNSENSDSAENGSISDSDGSLWDEEAIDGKSAEHHVQNINAVEDINQDEQHDSLSRFLPFLHRGLVTHFKSPHITSLLQPTSEDAVGKGNPDWAMFLMTKCGAFLLRNSIQIPGKDSPTFIESIISREDLSSGPVWIAAGSGLQKGFLGESPASVFLWGTFRDVNQITLERCLAHGDSGSWVIRDGKLCGYIVAGRDSLPWAYMVPIQDIFDNMTGYFSTPPNLPSRLEIENWKDEMEKVMQVGSTADTRCSDPISAEFANTRSTQVSTSYKIQSSQSSIMTPSLPQEGPDTTASEVTPLLAASKAGPAIQPNEETTIQCEGPAPNGSVKGDDDIDEKPLPEVQIFLLCFAGMTAQIALFGLFPFINKMIKETGNLNEVDVGFYSGFIESMFSSTQMSLMISWGQAADRIGRKPVIVFSLAGVAIATSAFGVSKTIWQMVLFRCCTGVLAGAIMTVRVMITESSTTETRARAFRFLAFSVNVGISLGSVLGGGLSNPTEQYPRVLGRFQFLKDYPYSLPTFVTSTIAASAAIVCGLFVEETLERKVRGLEALARSPMSTWEIIKAPGVGIVLFIYSHAVLVSVTYTALFPVFWFTRVDLGGYGFSPLQISLFLGAIGVSQALWLLFVFPRLQHKYRTGNVLRGCLIAWLIVIISAPLCNIFLRHNWTTAFWIVATVCQIAGSGVVMAFTGVQLAVNDISPSPSALRKLHVIALALTAGVRTVAPAMITSLFATGARNQFLDGHLVWVILFFLALLGTIALRWLPEKAKGKLKDDDE